jgi:hypothetical protein
VKRITAAIILLICVSACSPEAPKASPLAAPPPGFPDVETLATRPDVVAIVIGTVVKDLGEEKGPAGGIYHRWEIVVEQFIIGQGPDRIITRITKAVQAGKESSIPTKESRLIVGERVLLFLSRSEGETPLKSNEFTMPGPLVGKYVIENDSARAAGWSDAPSIPLDELITKIKTARPP